MAILVAIREDERSREAARIAYDLASAYDDTLVALHVVPSDDYDRHRESIEGLPEFGEYPVTQQKETARRFAEGVVRETIDDVDTGMLEARGRVGDVPEEILNEAAEVEPRYLVIGGRRRSPAGKALFGNTAQKILLNADCPVVTDLTG